MRYSTWSVRLVTAVVVPLLTAVVAAPAAAEDVTGDRLPRQVLQGLLGDLVAPDIPGAVGFARDGDQTWRGASGLADIATGRPMDPADRYKVGSVTKTFTATVVLQLVGEGRLGLQDSVQRWLPGLVPNGKNIKVRHLLQHTSGLYDYLADPRIAEPYLVNGDLDFVWRPLQLIAIAVEHPPLFAPGTSWSYSNTGYVLLGLIVEAATGTTMQHQLEARIFRPLGLEQTTFPVTNTRIAGPHAHGYLSVDGVLTDFTGLSPSWAWSAGNIVSSTADVARFFRALLRGRLLPRPMLRAMQTTVRTGNLFDYGLGLASLPLPCGGTVWGHEGGLPGYENWALSTRDGTQQVITMINAGTGDDKVELVLVSALQAFCAVRGT